MVNKNTIMSLLSNTIKISRKSALTTIATPVVKLQQFEVMELIKPYLNSYRKTT